jgi:hypothetical protein
LRSGHALAVLLSEETIKQSRLNGKPFSASHRHDIGAARGILASLAHVGPVYALIFFNLIVIIQQHRSNQWFGVAAPWGECRFIRYLTDYHTCMIAATKAAKHEGVQLEKESGHRDHCQPFHGISRVDTDMQQHIRCGNSVLRLSR